MEILDAVYECLNQTVENLKQLTINPADIVAVGITNQRETSIVWDSQTGKPLYNAIGNFEIMEFYKIKLLLISMIQHVFVYSVDGYENYYYYR